MDGHGTRPLRMLLNNKQTPAAGYIAINFMNNQGDFARPKEYLDDYDFLVADDATNSIGSSGTG